jgi:ubiquinone/menaquinone biosynthesis C-methylase UbiE
VVFINEQSLSTYNNATNEAIMTDEYVLGHLEQEQKRLDLQAALFENETLNTLKLVGIRPGMRCLDVGCGAGHVSFLMSKLVGMEGSVVGLDADVGMVNLCKMKAKQKDINNVEFIAVDVHNCDLKKESFDLVYSRFLFQHLKEPKKALMKMKELTTKRGVIVIEEEDMGIDMSYPHAHYHEKLRKLYGDLLQATGSDPFIGRKIYSLFLDCGLEPHVGAYAICLTSHDEPYKKIGILTAQILKSNLLKYGLISETEFGEMLNGLQEFQNSPIISGIFSLTFRVWSNKC